MGVLTWCSLVLSMTNKTTFKMTTQKFESPKNIIKTLLVVVAIIGTAAFLASHFLLSHPY